MKLLVLALYFIFSLSSNLVQASCFEQVSELFEQYTAPTFKLVVVGEKKRNRFTRMISIAEDLKVEINDEADALRVARLVAPRNQKKQEEVLGLVMEQIQSGESDISLKIIAPEAVGRLTNETPKCDGPNCFNATLNWFFPEAGIRSTSDIEITEALSSKFKLVEVGREIEFGDVLVFRTPSGEVVHTAIYLNKEFGWHKGANSQIYSWNFENHFGIFEMYGRSSDLHAEVEVFRFIPNQ